MRPWLRSHLTYANVMVTILAFIVLTGGTAVALGGANTVQSDDLGPGAQVLAPDVGANAVNGSDIVDSSLGSADLAGNSVGESETGANSVGSGEVINGSIATFDLAASTRGARAYGHVSGAGILSRSKNVVSVSHPFAGGGLYCITVGGDIDLASAVLIAEPDFLGSGTSVASDNASVVQWDSGASGCPAGTLKVLTLLYDGDSTDDDDGGGNTTGDNLVVDDEPFTFVVP